MLLPGVLGLHVHLNGDCHAHPFDDHDDHEDGDEDRPTSLPAEHRHSAADTDCRPAWLAEDGSPNRVIPLWTWTEPTFVGVLDPPKNYVSAYFSTPPDTSSIPIFLRQRHLLI